VIIVDRLDSETQWDGVRALYISCGSSDPKAIRDREKYIVAADTYSVVGSAMFWEADPDTSITLYYILVHRDRRSMGIGGKLLIALAEHAHANGFTCLRTYPSVRGGRELRERRVAFFERYGFTLQPTTDDDWPTMIADPSVVMAR
jgi:GNAT superfamily N-acetyltransferase